MLSAVQSHFLCPKPLGFLEGRQHSLRESRVPHDTKSFLVLILNFFKFFLFLLEHIWLFLCRWEVAVPNLELHNFY